MPHFQTHLIALCCLTIMTQSFSTAEEIDVWLGTSNSASSKGIYHCTLNAETGKLSESRLVAEIRGPGFLAMHPKRTHLYAVGTLHDVPCVAAYGIVGTGKNSALELVNSVPIGDGGAAHVSVDAMGRMLLTAQYGGGSVAAFKLANDGSIEKQTTLINHEGGSRVVEGRQTASHAHWTGFSPDQRFAFVPDLGLDQVVIYRVNAADATLHPHGTASVPPGGGPRHMKFSPSGKWVYVLNELALSVSVFDYDAEQGSMTLKQTVPTVNQAELDLEQFKSCSEIRVHPNGKFVYAANRGHDSITAFSVGTNGELTAIQNVNVRGATPRNFNLAPNARWLLVGGQDSHTLASFEIEPTTGLLIYNRSIINTPAPICVVFGPE